MKFCYKLGFKSRHYLLNDSFTSFHVQSYQNIDKSIKYDILFKELSTSHIFNISFYIISNNIPRIIVMNKLRQSYITIFAQHCFNFFKSCINI